MTESNVDVPLKGLRIVVTRAKEQAEGLVESLRRLGASVIEAPAIRIEPPIDWAPLDEAIERLARYDWIIFTSVNGVKFFTLRMERTGHDPDTFIRSKIAAIGPATEAALAGQGIGVDVVPPRYVAEEVYEALHRFSGLERSRILLPRADIAREALPGLLRSAGAEVDVVVAYRTVPDRDAIRRAMDAVLRGGVDVVTFTSGSTVRSFFSAIDDPQPVRGKFISASIGPITSEVLRERGFPPEIEARKYTSRGLVESIVEYYESHPH